MSNQLDTKSRPWNAVAQGQRRANWSHAASESRDLRKACAASPSINSRANCGAAVVSGAAGIAGVTTRIPWTAEVSVMPLDRKARAEWEIRPSALRGSRVAAPPQQGAWHRFTI